MTVVNSPGKTKGWPARANTKAGEKESFFAAVQDPAKNMHSTEHSEADEDKDEDEDEDDDEDDESFVAPAVKNPQPSVMFRVGALAMAAATLIAYAVRHITRITSLI